MNFKITSLMAVLTVGALLRGSSQDSFDLTCQIPTVYSRLLHSIDVSPPMGSYYNEGALKSAISNFEDWMRVKFESGVYSAVDTFSDKKIFDAANSCWKEIRPIQKEAVKSVLETIKIQETGSDKRSVYDALYRAANIDWDANDAAGKGRKVVIVYTTEEPNSGAALPPFNNSTDCENVDYPTTLGAITELINNGVSPIFVVPRELIDLYRNLFMTDIVVPFSNDVAAMTLYLQMAIDALYCNGPIIIPDASTPTPFTTVYDSTSIDQDCSVNAIAQILLVQDISYSYTNDMAILRQKMPEIVLELSLYFSKLEIGLVSFSDKPIQPYGYPGDHCYREVTPISGDYTNFTTALAELQILSGNDWRESQYDALMNGIMSADLKWNPNDTVDGSELLRIALVATDSGPHVAGDSVLPPYDTFSTPCAEQDYPSVEVVGSALDARRVWPVFIVTPDVEDYWRTKASLIVTEHTPRVVGLHGTPKEIAYEIANVLEFICNDNRRLNVAARNVR